MRVRQWGRGYGGAYVVRVRGVEDSGFSGVQEDFARDGARPDGSPDGFRIRGFHSSTIEYSSEVIIGSGRGCSTVTLSQEFAGGGGCVGESGVPSLLGGRKLVWVQPQKPLEAENWHIFEIPPRKFGDPEYCGKESTIYQLSKVDQLGFLRLQSG